MVILAILMVVFVVKLIQTANRERKPKLGKLYFKEWPTGERSFHLALDVELSDVKEGEVYTITVKEEKPTDAELEIIREVSEE